MNRRQLLLGGLLALSGLGRGLARAPQARVVIVGGGFAGATCARALRRLDPALAITVVEPRAAFCTGPMSNAAIAGVLPLAEVTVGPQGLPAAGIDWCPQRVVALDPARRRVQLEDGRQLEADELILAPGIQLRTDLVEGLHPALAAEWPSAWLGDADVGALAARVAALRQGDEVIIAAPPLPYRCPPGPYERASLIAWSARERGIRIRITVLDAKDDFTKRAAFLAGWARAYPGVIDWRPRREGGQILRVDADRRRLITVDGRDWQADLISLIPPQTAPEWMIAAGLTDATGWCPVDASGFRSRRQPTVRIIGDAADVHPVPKSAFAAQGQAELCALAVVAERAGRALPAGLLLNTCYSLIHPRQAISVAARYAPIEGRFSRLSEGASGPDQPEALGASEADQAFGWYRHARQRAFGERS